LDETGQQKKGLHTAGVARQYGGCAGQVANAVNVVYCTYAGWRGHAQVGALYLPKGWTTDPERCERVGVGPPRRGVQDQPQLAVDLLTDLDTAGVLPPWVTADEVLRPRPRPAGLLRGPRHRLRARGPMLVPHHPDLPP